MMSDRERWIVYPLLAAALGLGIKREWIAWRGTSQFNAITCQSLLLTNQLNENKALLQENEQGAAELRLAGPEELLEVSLTADTSGGRLMLMRRDDQKAIVLGHDKLREISGLWAVDRNTVDEVIVPLTVSPGTEDAWKLIPWPKKRSEKEKEADQ